MVVLGNPILGTILSRFGLVLKQDGLYKRINVDGLPDEEFFLTDDVRDICKLFGIDFDEFNDAQGEDAFKLIMGCETFVQYMFLNRGETSSTLLQEFRKYVEENELENNDFILIRTKRVEDILGIELRSKIDSYYRVLNGYEKSGKNNFNKMKDVLLADGYTPQNFSTDIPRFKDSFESYFEYKKFMLDSSTSEIVKRFRETSVDNLKEFYLDN